MIHVKRIHFLHAYYNCYTYTYDTFNHLSRTWIRKVEVHGPPNVQLMLLGNKCDLRTDKGPGGTTAVDYLRAKVSISSDSEQQQIIMDLIL